jgi:multidrug efflux system membrane fusion protein
MQGTLVHDKGLLNQAESDLKRYAILSKKNYTSVQQTVDQQFLVEQDKGTVMVDEAAIETAKLNLAYCHIVAPVTGRVGLRLADPGIYLQPTNTTALLVVTQLR